ncbi:unnamed protein product, partial [Rotaria magnacalcarata]
KSEKSCRCRSRSHPYADNEHKKCCRLVFVSPCSQLPIEYLPDGFQRFKPNNISNDDSISIMHHFQTDETDDSNDYHSPFHPYTDMLTNSFCFRLIKSLHQSKLLQSECHILFDLTHSALPSPNNLPVNINKLLQKIELNQIFFRKTNMSFML